METMPDGKNNVKHLHYAVIMIIFNFNLPHNFYFMKAKIFLYALLNAITFSQVHAQSTTSNPMRVAVAGATHGHVPWILNRKNKTDIILVGVYEPNNELAQRYAKQYGFSTDFIYNDL